MDLLTLVVVPLVVSLIAGGVALYLGRPSKVATKAATIVEVALDLLQKELDEERRASAEHRRQCTAQIQALSAEVIRLGGNLDRVKALNA